MKLFVPAVGYRIKLTSDWSFKLHPERRNDTLYEVLTGKEMPNIYRNWRKPEDYNKQWSEAIIDVRLEAGTVLEVDRVYVRTTNKSAQSNDDDFDSLTFKVVEHPTLRGKKRQLRFWAKLVDVNTIEYELPIDLAAGKDKARENAKKPKKLTPQLVKLAVRNAIYEYENTYHDNVPDWLSVATVEQLSAVAEEYRRCERARYELNVKMQQAALEHSSRSGEISVPLTYADRVKMVQEENNSYNKWTYVITHNIMGSNVQCVFSKLLDGTRCRTFRPDKPRKHSYDKDAPDVTHIWVKVYSDADDLNVVKLEAGFDDKA